MELEPIPDFMSLARTSIEIFHPEVLSFPDDIVKKAVERKALKLRESYETMLIERRHQV